MIVCRIHAALLRIRGRYLRQSAPGRGISYVLDQWPALERFLYDGRLEIDNNLCENAIRPTAVGKRTGCSSALPTLASEEPSSIPSSRAAVAAESIRWPILRDVLSRLPKMLITEVPCITPQAWAKAQRQAPDLKAAS